MAEHRSFIKCLLHERDQLLQSSLVSPNIGELDPVHYEGIGFAILQPEREGGFSKALVLSEITVQSWRPGLMEHEIPSDRSVRHPYRELSSGSEMLLDPGIVASL